MRREFEAFEPLEEKDISKAAGSTGCVLTLKMADGKECAMA